MATQMTPHRTAADILGSSAQARGNAASQATVVEQSRAIAEVQGALMVADRRPRDKSRALNDALESCRTREVAEAAFFKFNRGGGSVAGETVHLARELARCWGNIVHAVVELDRDDEAGKSEMMAYAWDLETNARAQLQFIVPHLRDKKGGASRLTDARDIYENNANMGARRLRECIFAVLPNYLVKSASDECRRTLERGESEEPAAVRTAKLLTAFAAIGIDKARIEVKMGNVANFTAVDLANLRIAYQSIKRQEINAEDEFPRLAAGAAPAASKLDMLEQATDHDPNTGEIETGRGAEDMGEPHTTDDAEAQIMAHLAGKVRVTDVDSLVRDRMGELDEDGQQRLRDAAQVQRDNILAGSVGA